MNPFQVLGVPFTFNIDRGLLDERFQSVQVHALSLPQPLKETYILQANVSYNTIKNPIQRAHSIMEILRIVNHFFDIFDDIEEFMNSLNGITDLKIVESSVYDDFEKSMVDRDSYGMHLAYAKMKRLKDCE